MLPFTKRPPRLGQESSEVISTDEIEIVTGPGSARKMQTLQTRMSPASERPRVFQRSLSDEDMTLLMPHKPKLSSSPPPPPMTRATPASARPVPAPNLRGLVRPRLDEERTILRPSAPAPSPSVSPMAAPASAAPAMLPTPYMPFKPPQPPPPPPKLASEAPLPQVHAVHTLPARPQRDSDPPAAVITARTKVTTALRKPNISWAAALMAAGVFVGLVTAVLARGDGDALIDATAAFVDPSSHGSRAAAAQPQTALFADKPEVKSDGKGAKVAPLGTGACLDPSTAPTLPQVVSSPKEPAIASAKVVDETAGRPEQAKPAPFAYATPAAPPAAAPQPAPVHVAQAAAPVQRYSAPTPAPAPKPVQVAAASHPQPAPQRAAPAHAASEMDSAAAADALAKAQLEASLR